MRTIRNTFVAALAAVTMAACASGGAETPETPADEAGGMSVEIQNTTVPPTTLVVYMIPETGTREMLGTVDPSATRSFRFDPTLVPERYRILAETTAGAEIISRPFTLTGDAAGLTWDVSVNTVRMR